MFRSVITIAYFAIITGITINILGCATDKDLIKKQPELRLQRDYEHVKVEDLTPGKNLQEKINIYLDKAKVRHFRRRMWLNAVLKRYWKDVEHLEDDDFHAQKYNKELLELLQRADKQYYPTREKEEKRYPKERDPGYGWTTRKLFDDIIKDLHITADPDKDKQEKVIELIDKLQSKVTEAGLTQKEREVLKRHSAASYLKIGGKEHLKEYLGPPPDIEESIKKIGQELQMPKEEVYKLIFKLESPSKEKRLSPKQREVLRKNKAGKYLKFFGKRAPLEYLDVPH